MDTSTLAVLPKKKEGNRVPILRQKLKKVIIWLTNLRHADGALSYPLLLPPPPSTPLPISAQIYGYFKLLIATRKEKESNQGFKFNWEWNSGPLAQKAEH